MLRDAVALGVGAADARRVGEVDAEAVGRGQAGALADQHHHQLRPAARRSRRPARRGPAAAITTGARRPAFGRNRIEPPQQRHGMRLHGDGGEAVRDRDDDLRRRPCSAFRSRQAAAEVRAAEVGGAIRRCAAHAQRGVARAPSDRAPADRRPARVHRVARPRVRRPKSEHSPRSAGRARRGRARCGPACERRKVRPGIRQ